MATEIRRPVQQHHRLVVVYRHILLVRRLAPKFPGLFLLVLVPSGLPLSGEYVVVGEYRGMIYLRGCALATFARFGAAHTSHTAISTPKEHLRQPEKSQQPAEALNTAMLWARKHSPHEGRKNAPPWWAGFEMGAGAAGQWWFQVSFCKKGKHNGQGSQSQARVESRGAHEAQLRFEFGKFNFATLKGTKGDTHKSKYTSVDISSTLAQKLTK